MSENTQKVTAELSALEEDLASKLKELGAYKNRALDLFDKYLDSDPSEINFDKNANAAAFSFSNFAMDYAAEGLANMTRSLVSEEAKRVIHALEDEKNTDFHFCLREEGYNIESIPVHGMTPDEVGDFYDSDEAEGTDDYSVPIFPEDVSDFWNREAHTRNAISKDFYFHDITKGIIPYCYATSTGRLLAEGLQYIDDYPSGKPGRFDSYLAQVIDLVLEMSQDHAGAIAIPDLFVNAAEFFKDAEAVWADHYHIANEFQSMIFTFHRKVRPSGQSPFVNVTISDGPTLKEVFKQTPEQIEVIKALQEVFLGEFIKGIKGKPFRFPVTTANIALDPEDPEKNIVDMDWVKKIAKFLKTGRLNIYISKDPRKFASCCRMTNDLDLLMDMVGVDSFGNGGVRIGSHRVITLNMPKIVQDCDRDCFTGEVAGDRSLLSKTVLASVMLKAHRELLRRLVDHKSGKFLKFFKHNWENLDANFFSTIGIIGVWEAAKISLSQEGIEEPTIRQIVDEQKRLLGYVKCAVDLMSKSLKMPMNLEQIPGESSAADLAAEVELPILSNQYIPLWEEVDLVDRIKYAGELDSFYSGGAITFLNLEKELTEEAIINVVTMAARAGMTHFAPTHIYSQCIKDHNTIGKHDTCPICGEVIKDYVTRIIGYFVPVSSWNKSRKLEFNTRQFSSEI